MKYTLNIDVHATMTIEVEADSIKDAVKKLGKEPLKNNLKALDIRDERLEKATDADGKDVTEEFLKFA